MANTDVLIPSEEHGFYSRLMLFLINGSKVVLKDHFDFYHPPSCLQQHLQTTSIKNKLDDLRKKNVINDDQYRVLYPPFGYPSVDSDNFDITLLACLLRNVCGLDKSPVWRLPKPASPLDISLEADVVRLKRIRNKIIHKDSATMTKHDFEFTWDKIEKILIRQGSRVNDLSSRISKLKHDSLDPVKEKQYMQIIENWETSDKAMQAEYEAMLKQIDQKLDTNNRTIVDMLLKSQMGQESLKTILEKEKKPPMGSKNILDQHSNKITRHKALKRTSPSFRRLLAQSKYFFESFKTDDVFVKTDVYTEAAEILKARPGVLVLCGDTGEGKTTMAAQLLLDESTPEKCLNLRSPSDWETVDPSLGLFDSILIDDIFGLRVLDESHLKKWRGLLPDILRISNNAGIKLIITTRPYILQEGQQKIRRMSLFSSEQIVTLSSEKLSQVTKRKMLELALKKNNKNMPNDLVELCLKNPVTLRRKSRRNLTKNAGLGFGFPECVSLFTTNDALFEKGPIFFSEPFSYLKSYMHDLIEDDDKFIALTVLWSWSKPRLKITDTDMTRVEEIARLCFSTKTQIEIKAILVKSLQALNGSIIRFSNKDGSFSFTNRVIYDALGLILGENDTTKSLMIRCCSRDFLMRYLSVDGLSENCECHVPEFLYIDLAKRIIELMLIVFEEERTIHPPQCKNVKLSGLLRLMSRTSQVFKKVKVTRQKCVLDTRLVGHHILQIKNFVAIVLDYILTNGLRQTVFETCIMSIDGALFSYGLTFKEFRVCLISYCLLEGHNDTFAKEAIAKLRMSLDGGNSSCFEQELQNSLLIAIARKDTDLVSFLLEQNANVTGDAIYIATHIDDSAILSNVLKHNKHPVDDKGHAFNGNNALIVAARKGLIEPVRILLKNGANVEATNANKMNALYNATVHQKRQLCELLIENGADIDRRAGKFQRAPLHMAADAGYVELVKLFLRKGACVTRKDRRGHSPIHCATMQGHLNVVGLLLEHDPSLATFRATSYGRKSFMKGFTIFHIAAWKNNVELVRLLLNLNVSADVQDCYGRTPAYIAAFYGHREVILELLPVSNLNKAQKEGMTPLHAAVCAGSYDIVSLLCQLVNINARNKHGQTPLHLACKKTDLPTVEKLITCGADWTVVTKAGDTVFQSDKVYSLFKNKDSLEEMRNMIELRRVHGLDSVSSKKTFPNAIMNVIASTDPDFTDKLRILPCYIKEEFSFVWLTQHQLFKFVVIICLYMMFLALFCPKIVLDILIIPILSLWFTLGRIGGFIQNQVDAIKERRPKYYWTFKTR